MTFDLEKKAGSWKLPGPDTPLQLSFEKDGYDGEIRSDQSAPALSQRNENN